MKSVEVCTFHCGTPQSLVVLNDWISYIGPDCPPLRIATVLERVGNVSEQDVRAIWPACTVVPVEPSGLSLAALEPAAVFETIRSSDSEWILLIKLDTIPYVSNPGACFLQQLIEHVEANGFWGATGSFVPPADRVRFDGSYATTRYSNNFSLFRRQSWVDTLLARRADFIGDIAERILTASSRFVIESTIEDFLLESGERMYFVEDSIDRSVFHINKWEADLLRIRQRYLLRDGVFPFLNVLDPVRGDAWTYPPWRRYYGHERPSFFARSRSRASGFVSRLYRGVVDRP